MATKNNIRSHRKKAGLTQADLAARADTSQQRIQRMEASVGPLHVEILHRIARVLDVTLDELVPSLSSGMQGRGGRRRASVATAETERPEIEREDAAKRWLTMWLIGNHEIRTEYPDADHDRISHVLADATMEWLWIEGPDLSVAVRIAAVESWRFEFDVPGETMTESEVASRGGAIGVVYITPDPSEEDDDEWVDVHFSSGRNDRHKIDGDRVELPADIDAWPDHGAEFQLLFRDLEMAGPDSTLGFTDEDGEEVHFRPSLVSAVITPFVNISPALSRAVREGEAEGGLAEE